MKKIILGCFSLYKTVRFMFPSGCCKFTPSCSEYAYAAFSKYSVLKAFKLVFARLIKCHFFSPGGVDYLS